MRHIPVPHPLGRASRVQICSRQICDSDRLWPIFALAVLGSVDSVHPAPRPSGTLASLLCPNRLPCRFVALLIRFANRSAPGHHMYELQGVAPRNFPSRPHRQHKLGQRLNPLSFLKGNHTKPPISIIKLRPFRPATIVVTSLSEIGANREESGRDRGKVSYSAT